MPLSGWMSQDWAMYSVVYPVTTTARLRKTIWGFGDEIAGQIPEKGQSSPIEERIVERAFAFLSELSQILKEEVSQFGV